MLICEAPAPARPPRREDLHADVVVVGGGIAGCCAAIAAARQGSQVVLIHDRPVLGGNASSEIRLWVLGATCHMGSNNRWAREGGIIDEILSENLWRNPDSNPLIFDTVLLEWVQRERGITLLLNTAMHSCEKHDDATIAAVLAWNPQNQTSYRVQAPLFIDSSGDGVLGFQAGAAFRMGAETADEFGEPFAPSEEYGSLLGHSIYFYTKDVGYEVPFVAPAFALDDIEGVIPRWRNFKGSDNGCRLWWIEWGGRLDTVHHSERIKWELWKVAYGVWGWMKNSGRFPETRTQTLEWFGHVPGKRESRRFEGDHLLTQGEVVAQRRFLDEVAYGGWAFDLHPADGVYAKHPGCTHIRAHGIYGIPYRCLYSRNISNLLLGGRVISVSHVAFGTTRVMGTLALCGQAVGTAAALCRERGCLPLDCGQGDLLADLQCRIQRAGVHLPSHPYWDAADLAARAEVSYSSRKILDHLPAAEALDLKCARGIWLPIPRGRMPRLTLRVDADQDAVAVCEWRACSRDGFHTPDEVLTRFEVPVAGGRDRSLVLERDLSLDRDRYVLVTIAPHPHLRVRSSDALCSGVLAMRQGHAQTGVSELGFHDFAWWHPERRPAPQTLALDVHPPLDAFARINSGWTRPTSQSNWWIAADEDADPQVTLRWPQAVDIAEIVLCADGDFEHPMEHVLYRHHDRVSPYLVREVWIRDARGEILAEIHDNRQSLIRILLPEPARCDQIRIQARTRSKAPVALAAIRVYGPQQRSTQLAFGPSLGPRQPDSCAKGSGEVC